MGSLISPWLYHPKNKRSCFNHTSTVKVIPVKKLLERGRTSLIFNNHASRKKSQNPVQPRAQFFYTPSSHPWKKLIQHSKTLIHVYFTGIGQRKNVLPFSLCFSILIGCTSVSRAGQKWRLRILCQSVINQSWHW